VTVEELAYRFGYTLSRIEASESDSHVMGVLEV
jgi:hypothetical protein